MVLDTFRTISADPLSIFATISSARGRTKEEGALRVRLPLEHVQTSKWTAYSSKQEAIPNESFSYISSKNTRAKQHTRRGRQCK